MAANLPLTVPQPDAAVDLSNCDREPIHIPDAIQPHGALLVLREPELTVLQASDNTGELFGVDAAALLGEPLDALLGRSEADRLREVLAGGDLDAANPLRLVIEGGGEARAWDGIVHRTGGGTVLELEPAEAGDPRSVGGLYARVRRGLGELQRSRTLPELCDTMAEEIRRLTGLDRVTVYRFDAEWNGAVVAEARAAGVDSFLGLHFPASDIPAQARELYRRNWLRLIADAGYTPARIVPALNPATGAPLDLSGSTLRSVSPIHLEYLRNMGVGASMSVSLLCEGRLWGLVACHHRAPKHVAYEVRTACEFLGQTFSMQLGMVAEEEDRSYALHVASVGARLLDRMAAEDGWARALTRGAPSLADLAGAAGAVVWMGGECFGVGEVPDRDTVAALVGWLAETDVDLFHTDHLAEKWPAAARHQKVASGLLAAAVSRGRGDYLLWFRPEVIRTVEWAGNPRKAVQEEDAHPVPRLHPRRSFEAWSETVRARSLPWKPAEIRAAAELRGRIVDIVLRQADTLKRLNEELRRSNDELDAFTYIASHDLKEPLRGIHNLSRMLLEDQGHVLGADGVEQAQTLLRLSDRMDTMLTSPLRYARAGNLDLRTADVDLQTLMEEVLDTLQPRLQEGGVQARIPRRLPVVRCDPVRVGSVFQNLISNAIKYTDKSERWVEIGWNDPEAEGAPPVLYVRDNGIGIAPRHWDAIWRIFRRLHGRGQVRRRRGAGLTIVKKLVERHGGRIWLESEPGQGTTFYFTLESEA